MKHLFLLLLVVACVHASIDIVKLNVPSISGAAKRVKCITPCISKAANTVASCSKGVGPVKSVCNNVSKIVRKVKSCATECDINSKLLNLAARVVTIVCKSIK